MDNYSMTGKLFAILLFVSGITFAACQSYGETCTANGDCCAGLACDASSGKCNQLPLVCDIMPEEYSCSAEGEDCKAGCCPGLECNNAAGKCAVPTQAQAGTPEASITELEEGSGLVKSTSGIYRAGWFSDWKIAGAIGIATMVAIIALAAILGHAFNIPQAKAFVDSELTQAIASAILMAGIIGMVIFLDIVSKEVIAGGDLPVTCDPTGVEPCYISAATQYIDSLYNIGRDYARQSLVESLSYQQKSSLGISTQFNVWWAAFAGVSSRPNAGWSLKGDRAAAAFENVSRLLATLYAQKYFIEIVSFGIAPIFLVLGALLRTFFFTRKLGGLMLAIAISLFIVYPLTYAFAWYTLNVTVYGERAFAGPGADELGCPGECSDKPPVAFFIENENGVGRIRQFSSTQEIQRAGITNDNWEGGGPDGRFPGLVACISLETEGIDIDESKAPNQCEGCPEYCREVPLPALPGCDAEKCAACNPGCKIMRQRSDCPTICSSCTGICRTTQPVENKCYFTDEKVGSANIQAADLSVTCEKCNDCPAWCKIIVEEADGTRRLMYDDAACQVDACKPASLGGECPDKCMYETQMGETSSCDTACTFDNVQCPSYCRIAGIYTSDVGNYDVSLPPLIESECEKPKIMDACKKCPDECKVSLTSGIKDGCAPYPTVSGSALTDCIACPDYCRYNDYSFIESYSLTPMVTSRSGALVPSACVGTSENGQQEIVCDGTGSPPPCGAECKITSPPQLCRGYDPDDGDLENCRNCPHEARFYIEHTGKTGIITYNSPPLIDYSKVDCGNEYCQEDCKSGTVLVAPSEAANPLCKDYDYTFGSRGEPRRCELCKPGCRVTGLDESWLESSCTRMAIIAPAVESRSLPKSTIEIRFDNGNKIYINPCDEAHCPSVCKVLAPTEVPLCTEYLGTGLEGCRQCPENCRIKYTDGTYYTGDCGGLDNVDCSILECPSMCRAAMAPASATPSETAVTGCSNSGESCDAKPCCGSLSCNDLGTGKVCGVQCNGVGDACGGANDCCTGLACRDEAYFGEKVCVVDCSRKGEACIANGDCCSGLNCVGGTCSVPCSGILQPCLSGCCEGLTCNSGMCTFMGTAQCAAYQGSGMPCASCPALCRRTSQDMPPSNPEYCPEDACGSYNPATGLGCNAECKLDDAPDLMCEACAECPSDCLYYPATRTDCSDVCSDEMLGGAINVGPQDFVKKLPGAEGEADMKNVGVLMVPALVLPLFCIVIVIAFIRVLSPLLGGDIEIPGLSRII